MARQKILIISHQYIDSEYVGGVELHVSETIKELRKNYDVVLVYVDPTVSGLKIRQFTEDDENFSVLLLESEINKFALCEEEIYEKLQNIISHFGIGLIHVHHTLFIGTAIFKLAKEKKIPIIYTIHDYYVNNPDFHQTYKFYDGEFHEIEPSIEHLKDFTEDPNFNLGNWQKEYNNILKDVTAITTPSQIVKDEIVKIYPEIESKIKIIPLGLSSLPKNKVAYNAFETKLKICFLGSVHHPNKGKELITKLVPTLIKDMPDIEIQLVGTDANNWKSLSGIKNLKFSGKYEKEDLYDILYDYSPHLVIFLSLTKETYSYTLSEAWAIGIPAISGPIGAQAERIKESGAGIVLEDFNLQNIVKRLKTLNENRDLLNKLKENVEKINNLTINFTIEEYEKLYSFSQNVIKKEIVEIEKGEILATIIERYTDTIKQKKLHIQSLDKSIEDHLNYIGELEKVIKQDRNRLNYLETLGGSLNNFYQQLNKISFIHLLFTPLRIGARIFRLLKNRK